MNTIQTPFSLHLSPRLIAGLVLAGLGVVVIMAILRNARIVIVPDGEAPDAMYRRWKRERPLNRLGKRCLFVAAIAAAFVGAGALVAFNTLAGIWAVIRSYVDVIINLALQIPVRVVASAFAASVGLTLFGWVGIVYSRRRWRASLTPDQLANMEAARRKKQEDRELFSVILAEARRLAQLIPDHLAIQNKMQYDTRRGSRAGQRTKIKLRIEWIGCTRSEIWFRFDGRPGRMPYGVSFYDIRNPNNHVKENIQYGIGRPVEIYEDREFNLFLRIGLKSSLKGIPKHVHWQEMIERLPASDPYAVVVGVGQYNRLAYQSLISWPHGLVLGATGNGKTSFLKQAFVTLVKRNEPDALQFVLIDLKRTEFNRFLELPHVARYADRPEDAIRTFILMHRLVDARFNMFNQAGVSDIDEYNFWKREKMTRYFVWCDELALLTRGGSTERRKEAIEHILHLVALGRSAGVHLIIGTQTISREVLPMDITSNMEGRVCFGVRNGSASTLAIGDYSALGLEPPGRCVFLQGSRIIELQTPFLSNAEIENEIAALLGEGEDQNTEPPPEVIRIFEVAAQNNGLADWRTIWNQLRPEIGQTRIKQFLKDWEYTPANKKTVMLPNGKRFLLAAVRLPGDYSNPPRRVFEVNGPLPYSLEEIEQMTPGYGLRVNEQAQTPPYSEVNYG